MASLRASFKQVAPFIDSRQHPLSRLLSYFGLGIGVLLLLCSIQMYNNIQVLLKDKHPKKDGFDYISVTKKITNENMAEDHSFTNLELEEIRRESTVTAATPLLANKFLVKATGSSMLPFTTDLFLESLDPAFIDTLPPDFSWREGQDVLPIIMAADYLELYNNVFAPSKDLPQFSEQSISAVLVQIECNGTDGSTHIFKGKVVGLSDRINSVLVPDNFLQWANNRLAHVTNPKPQRIFIKTRDANNPELLQFIHDKNYHVNKDKTKFGRVKQVLQAVVSGLSAFGVLVILLAMVLFSFYLQLTIARSKDNLQLLLLLGYSPSWLARSMARKWIPVYTAIMLISVLATQAFQYAFSHSAMKGREGLSSYICWEAGVTAVVLLVISLLVNQRLVKRLLLKMDQVIG